MDRKEQIEHARRVLREEPGYSDTRYTLAPREDDACSPYYHLYMRVSGRANISCHYGLFPLFLVCKKVLW